MRKGGHRERDSRTEGGRSAGRKRESRGGRERDGRRERRTGGRQGGEKRGSDREQREGELPLDLLPKKENPPPLLLAVVWCRREGGTCGAAGGRQGGRKHEERERRENCAGEREKGREGRAGGEEGNRQQRHGREDHGASYGPAFLCSRLARIAVSKTCFSPSCVSAEHSHQATAPALRQAPTSECDCRSRKEGRLLPTTTLASDRIAAN
jgi:hypothetical protein